MKLNKFISGAIMIAAAGKLAYHEVYGNYEYSYYLIICLALLGILSHMVFDGGEVSK